MKSTIEQLETAYLDAAKAYRSKLAQLQHYADELHKFIDARDELQGHPEFSGYLPETYFSGGELDPVGVAPKAAPPQTNDTY